MRGSRFKDGSKTASSFKSSPIAVKESLLAIQNCMIAHIAAQREILAPGYRGEKRRGSESGSGRHVNSEGLCDPESVGGSDGAGE